MANHATRTPTPEPSPAETLRLAVAAIRESVKAMADETGSNPDSFMLAVADWLDEFDGVASQFIRDDHPALKVASAYLGGDA